MNHAKKPLAIPLFIASIATGIELIIIVVFSILIIQLSNQLSAKSKTLYNHCVEEESDDETCDEYFDELTKDNNVFHVSPSAYGDTFLSTYVAIKNGTPISEDVFSYFVTLSEEYSDGHLSLPISNENLPSIYHASSSRRYERPAYAYPYGVARRISIDIPNEGCAMFDFFPNFQYIYKYSLEAGDCHEFD